MTIIIKNWADNFEKADNRRLKSFSWVAVPTKMDGKKFRRLSKMKSGAEIFGVFILLLELAGKMPEKGVLKDSDGDLKCEDMELMTGFPSKCFENAIPVLCSDDIGWLSDDTGATLGWHSGGTQPTVQDTTLQYKTEHTDIVRHLNEVTGQHYKANSAKTIELINARLKEGFTVEDFKKVISKKHKNWKTTEFEKFLRPMTLFGTKFEGYLNEKAELTFEQKAEARFGS